MILIRCVKEKPRTTELFTLSSESLTRTRIWWCHWLTWTDDLPLTRRLLYHWAKRANREPEFYTFFWICVEHRPQEVKRCKKWIARALPPLEPLSLGDFTAVIERENSRAIANHSHLLPLSVGSNNRSFQLLHSPSKSTPTQERAKNKPQRS